MKIGIVMPVVLQNQQMLDITMSAVRHIQSKHDMDLFVICNRLNVCTLYELQNEIRRIFPGYARVVEQHESNSSVSNSWNTGFFFALSNQAELLIAVANDTELRPDCIDALVTHASKSDADLCSGLSMSGRSTVDASVVTEGPDFSCFAMTPNAYAKHGKFDVNYRPAYFEDNDYHARIVLSGGRAECVHAAQFDHIGSGTVKLDHDMKRRVEERFEKNRDYFKRKWGSEPVNDAVSMRQKYFKNPFNDSDKPLFWFDKPSS